MYHPQKLDEKGKIAANFLTSIVVWFTNYSKYYRASNYYIYLIIKQD